MHRPPDLSDEQWADYQAEYRRCQEEHDEVLTQVTDREAQIEHGLIDSYEDYEFTWDVWAPAERSSASRPPAPAAPPAAAPRRSR